MTEFMLVSQKSRLDPGILFGDRIKQLGRHVFYVDGDDQEVIRQATNHGFAAHQISFTGTLDDAFEAHSPDFHRGDRLPRTRRHIMDRQIATRDGKGNGRTLFYFDGSAYIGEASVNIVEIERIEGYRSGMYSDFFLMSWMHSARKDYSEKPVDAVIEPFLGGAGGALASLDRLVGDFIGFEVTEERFGISKEIFERWCRSKGIRYTFDTATDSTHYSLDLGRTLGSYRFFHANSITDGPGIMSEFLGKDWEVMSDIPWGCVKCTAVGEEHVEDPQQMRRFVYELQEALVRMPAPLATIALNKAHHLSLPERYSRNSNELYAVRVYDISEG